MVTPKKPSCRALAPTVDVWQRAFAKANIRREDVIPKDTHTIKELCMKYRKDKAVLRLLVKGMIETGEAKQIKLRRLDDSGRLQTCTYYQVILQSNNK